MFQIRSFHLFQQRHIQLTMKLAPIALTIISLPTCNAFTRLAFHNAPTTPFSTSFAASIPQNKITSAPSFREQEGEKSIAEGKVVSFFPGGLSVVVLDGNEIFTPIKRLNLEGDNASKGDDLLGRLVKFQDGSKGIVIAQRPPVVFVYNNNESINTNLDGTVQVMDKMARIEIAEDMNLVDCFGHPKSSRSFGSYAIFPPIPKVSDISLINSPMLTGTTMIDVLAPIGRGQNMLFIGSDLQELRDCALSLFNTQAQDPKVKCIYAVTKYSTKTIESLRNLKGNVTIVAARQGIVGEVAQAAEAVAVAGAACSIAEAFAKEKGMDSVVVVDSIDLHKGFWDMTTRALVDIYGADAVVLADKEGGASSEMRGFYSSLIQRAANYRQKGYGSVTLLLMTTIPESEADDCESVFSPQDFESAGEKLKARINVLVSKNIPLSSANLRKIQIPIPSIAEGKRRMVLQHVDDLISMSDGQIWFDESLRRRDGQSPSMDPQRSITRIGIGADTDSRADAPAIRRIAEGVRLDLAQAASMEGAESTYTSKKQSMKLSSWKLAMQQIPGKSRLLSESCILLLSVSLGIFNPTLEKGGSAGTEMGDKVVEDLLQHVKSTVSENILSNIDLTFDISGESRKVLEEAVLSFKA
jgi:F0F1-type ATP synthase alpha subunit